ncbi:Nicotinate-nucleotide pyrophosphorylase [Diplonema papillatum]|nr:Nicotinate-nucleotide pyrophosphorylase [Diplonema papillatum]
MSRFSSLLPEYLTDFAKDWLRHDIPAFDVGGYVVGNEPQSAIFWAKSNMVMSGYPFVEAIFKELGCTVEWLVEEGTAVTADGRNRVKVGVVRGPVNRVLQGERTALEVLTRCSAVAFETARAKSIVAKASPQWSGTIAGTRKTTPGAYRMIEKYGLLVGGGDPHRYSLSTMTMLKDNHVDAAGSITKAVQLAKQAGGFSVKVEVEARNETEATEACAAGADVVMLDNFTPEALARVAPILKKAYPYVLLEVSGGITHETLHRFLIPGLDVLSMGCLTHSVKAVDISLKIAKLSKL